jgi:hypothetical protein
LHMLVSACYNNLFAYKMPMHRKYVRLRCVCHVFYDALFVLKFLSLMWASLKLPYESIMRATYGLPTKDGNT